MASWPHWYAPNRYLDLLYRALAAHGIEHVPHLPLSAGAMTRGPTPVSVAHLHWVEALWRERGETEVARLFGVMRLARFLTGARRRGLPVVWTVHNLEPHEQIRRTDRMGLGLLHRRADLRVFTSEWARRTALAAHPGGETLVLPIGNYDGVFPAPGPRRGTLEREGIDPARRVLLCAGQLRSYKGFDVAVTALDALPRGPYHLIIAGRPVPPHAGELAARARGRPDLSLITEDLSDQRLADLHGAADAVLLPYRRITGSAALLTALTFGRGVVTTDLPYFREILDPEPPARELVPPGDAEGLAAGVRRFFARDPAQRGRAARALADRYHWPRLVEPLAAWLRARGGVRPRA